MSPVLPFDVIALIIDIIEENKDTNLLKELALVSHLLWSLIPSSRSVADIYLPLSNFMTLSRDITSYLQRRDSSSYLKADQMLSSISANSRIK